jgi:hypothetical protein
VIFFFTTTFRPSLWPTQSPVQLGLRAMSLGVKSAKVQNARNVASKPLYAVTALRLGQGNFASYLCTRVEVR